MIRLRPGQTGAYLRSHFATKAARMEAAMDRAVLRGAQVLRSNTPVRTGHLRDGWVVMISRGRRRVANYVPYFKFVDRGTRHQAPAWIVVRSMPEMRAIVRDEIGAASR